MASLSLRFSWPLPKMTPGQSPSPGNVWTGIPHQPLQPTASTTVFRWCIFLWRALGASHHHHASVYLSHLRARSQGESSVWHFSLLHWGLSLRSPHGLQFSPKVLPGSWDPLPSSSPNCYILVSQDLRQPGLLLFTTLPSSWKFSNDFKCLRKHWREIRVEIQYI